LKSALPSSRKFVEMNCMMGLYLFGYCSPRPLIARTTSILYTSEMSHMNEVICFTNLSTLDSLPVFSKEVRANVAVDRFGSDRSGSMSVLHLATSSARCCASVFSVRAAANLSTGLLLVSEICSHSSQRVISNPNTWFSFLPVAFES